MPDNRMNQPCAAANDRPSGDEKRVRKVELQEHYRRIGIAAVAAAAGARGQPGKLERR